MRKTFALGLAFLALATLVFAGSAAAATPRVSARDAMEPGVVARINQIRRAHGLRPLRANLRLIRAATRHGNSLARVGYFRHELFTPTRSTRWTPFGTWIRWHYPGAAVRSWSAGENLAWGAPGLSSATTVRRWMASPSHRANILARGWREIGVAVVHVDNPRGTFSRWADVTVAVAEFGRRSY